MIYNGWSHILPGIGKAVYGAYYSLSYNDQLHEGVVWGFKSAGEVVLLTKTVVAWKATALYNLPGASIEVYEALMVSAGTPQGQAILTGIAEGLAPGPPSTAHGVGVSVVIDLITSIAQ